MIVITSKYVNRMIIARPYIIAGCNKHNNDNNHMHARGPTRFQITYALVEISFQNTKTVFKTQNQFSKPKISFQNTNQFSKHKSSSQNTNHRSNTRNQFSNRKYNQLQISKTSFSIGYE